MDGATKVDKAMATKSQSPLTHTLPQASTHVATALTHRHGLSLISYKFAPHTDTVKSSLTSPVISPSLCYFGLPNLTHFEPPQNARACPHCTSHRTTGFPALRRKRCRELFQGMVKL